MNFEQINHVGILVKDAAIAKRFYMEVLGLKAHHERANWLLVGSSSIHLLEFPEEIEAGKPKWLDTVYHRSQHVALQVTDLREILKVLLGAGLEPYQASGKSVTKALASADDSLDFGLGTIFVLDPDDNLVEFVQSG